MVIWLINYAIIGIQIVCSVETTNISLLNYLTVSHKDCNVIYLLLLLLLFIVLSNQIKNVCKVNM